jgi:hypothetical protein
MNFQNLFRSLVLSFILLTVPSITKVSAVEIKASAPDQEVSETNKFVVDSLKVKKCGNDEKSIDSKKLVILNCFKNNKKVIAELTRLGDDFWQNYNLQQILYIGNIIGTYPIVHKTNYSNQKPIYRPDKMGNLELLESKNIAKIVNDCSKNVTNILELQNNNYLSEDKGIEGEYSYNQMMIKFGTAFDFLGNVTEAKSIFAYFQRFKLNLKSLSIYTSKVVASEFRSTNIVFIQQNPTVSFGSFDKLLNHKSLTLKNDILNIILDEANQLKLQNIDEFTDKTLLKIVVKKLATENNIYNQSSSIEKSFLLKEVESFFSSLILGKKSIAEMDQISKSQVYSIKINEGIYKNRDYKNRVDSEFGRVELKKSNYHTFPILSVKNGQVFVLQGDGANPAFPYTITTIEKVLTKGDRVVTFQK